MSEIGNLGLSYPPPSTEQVRQALMRVLGPKFAGYVLIQVNGQRKFFNPYLKYMYTPAEGCEVFVGRLPRDAYEDELVPLFLSIGPIYEFRTMMNFSGTTRGFGFVKFFDRETAQRAIRQLDNYAVRPGQAIGVVASVNNRRLCIKGFHAKPDELRDFLLNSTDDVEAVRLYPFKSKTSKFTPFQYAVVLYKSHRAAAMARRKLIPIKDEVFGPNIDVDWANPRRLFL